MFASKRICPFECNCRFLDVFIKAKRWFYVCRYPINRTFFYKTTNDSESNMSLDLLFPSLMFSLIAVCLNTLIFYVNCLFTNEMSSLQLDILPIANSRSDYHNNWRQTKNLHSTNRINMT